jgi:ferritin
MSKESSKTSQELELEQKLKALEKELEHEKLRTKALNTLIDVAEKELKISIRKKSGAKQ